MSNEEELYDAEIFTLTDEDILVTIDDDEFDRVAYLFEDEFMTMDYDKDHASDTANDADNDTDADADNETPAQE